MALDLEGFNELADVGEPDLPLMERMRFDDSLEIPWQMTDLDVWYNYCDEDLYQLDKLVLGLLRRTEWKRRTKGEMKMAVPQMFAILFGRMPTAKDGTVCRTMHQLLDYYCTRKTGSTTVKGKRVTRVYYFSRYSVNKRKPYSIRLRLEENNNENSFRNSPEVNKLSRPHISGSRDNRDVEDDAGGDGTAG